MSMAININHPVSISQILMSISMSIPVLEKEIGGPVEVGLKKNIKRWNIQEMFHILKGKEGMAHTPI